MACRANGRKGIFLGVLVLSAATFIIGAAPYVSAAQAKGTWLSRAGGLVAAAGSALLLKKNLEKRHEELFGILDDSYDAADKGDIRKADAAFERVKKIPGKLLVDQFPILKIGASIPGYYQNAKRRIKRFLGRDDEIDHGLALAPVKSESERKLLGSKPLPKPRGIRFSRRRLPVAPGGNTGATAWGVQNATRARVASRPAKSSSFEERVKAEQRARPNCYGIVSDETAAECDRKSKSGKWSASKPVSVEASRGSDDRWDSGVGAGAKLKNCFDAYQEMGKSRKEVLWTCCRGTFDDLYVDRSKCDRSELREILIEKLKAKKPSKEKTIENDSDKARKEYEAALSRAEGEYQGVSGSGDYRAALNDLEEKERQAREAAERRRIQAAEREAAERRRIEKARREMARKQEEMRKSYGSPMENIQKAIQNYRRSNPENEMARRQAEIDRRNREQALKNITQSIQNLSNAYLRSKGFSAPGAGSDSNDRRGRD